MGKLRKSLAKVPLLGPSLLRVQRALIGLGYFRQPLLDLGRWVFTSSENTNFTYDLDALNTRYLTSMLADVLGLDFDVVGGYIAEITDDDELSRHIAARTAASDLTFRADGRARLGRRVGWYAVVRALKPCVVIESGVDKGLGACVLAAALLRNAEEGHPGRYYGTDVDREAGYLLAGRYADVGEILYGDSRESLEKFAGTIDLFINDSDHSAAYEASEYSAIEHKLSERAVVLGDNSRDSGALLDFSLRAGRRFVYFQERPSNHWYPGAGIGVSFRRWASG